METAVTKRGQTVVPALRAGAVLMHEAPEYESLAGPLPMEPLPHKG